MQHHSRKDGIVSYGGRTTQAQPVEGFAGATVDSCVVVIVDSSVESGVGACVVPAVEASVRYVADFWTDSLVDVLNAGWPPPTSLMSAQFLNVSCLPKPVPHPDASQPHLLPAIKRILKSRNILGTGTCSTLFIPDSLLDD